MTSKKIEKSLVEDHNIEFVFIQWFAKRAVAAIVCAVSILICGFVANAQPAQSTENSKDQALRGSGRINSSTLAMEFSLPLGDYPGRGINVPISLSYSSKVWRAKFINRLPRINNPGDCISLNVPRFADNSAAGWTSSLAAPYVEYVGWDNVFNSDGYPLGPGCESTTSPPEYYDNAIIKRIVLHLPSGETHELRIDDNPATYAPSSSQPSKNGTYYAVDSSNIRYIEDSSTSTYKVQMPDGSFYTLTNSTTTYNNATIRNAERYTDRNGNYNTFNSTNNTWTDTLGRTLAAPLGLTAPGSPTTQTYTMPGLGGGSNVVTYKLYWKKLKDTSAGESGLTDFGLDLKYEANRASASPTDTPRTSGFLFTSQYSAWLHDAGAPVFNPIVLTDIELPTGQKYKFTYDIYGRIERIYYPTGGEERFTYGVIAPLAPSDDDNVNDQMNFGVTNRKVYQTAGTGTPYEWNYGVNYVAPNGYKVSITNPDDTVIERFLFQGGSEIFGFENILGGMAYEERGFDAEGHMLSRKLTHWSAKIFQPTGFTADAGWHLRVDHEESTVYDTSGNGVTATTKIEYEGDLNYRDTPVLPNRSTTYAFVAKTDGGSYSPGSNPNASPTPVPTSTTATPVRISETTYLINDTNYSSTIRDAYEAQNMIGLATVSKVKDGSGTVVAQSETVYDESGRSPGYRGNSTTAKAWDSTKGASTSSASYIATHAKFDTFGNQYEVTDALGNTTTTTFDGTYNAFPATVTSPVPDSTNTYGSNTAFVTSATFDPTTGLPLTTTDANGLRTEIEYDGATLRPRFVRTFSGSTQVGGTSETIYHDETGNYWVKSKTQIDDSHYAESITYFDGLGRAWKSEQLDSGGNIFTEKEFDADGRVLRVSNPYRTGETKLWTTNVYDNASRVVEIDLPDSSKIYTDYGVSISGTVGVTKTITDQAGKKRKGYSDVLGNMIRVVEDPAGQNLATDYVFDTLGNLRKTTQGDQHRYFMHDSLGRLLYAKQPEQEANTSFSATDPVTSNALWSVKYEYDDNSNITKTTDAIGVYVEGTYDHLNRITNRNYSDTTPDVLFFYDGKYKDSADAMQTATGSVLGKTTGIKSSVSKTNYTSFDVFGRPLTHQQITDGQTYNTGYSYNLSGVLIEETYPSGRVVRSTFGVDGQLTQVQSKKDADHGFVNYAESISYNASGAVTKMQLGNGRWETAIYNDRLQITQIGLGTTDSMQDLLKLNYDYGTSTQNNGSLREQRINFSGLSNEIKQTYSYDDLNRLKSSTETVSNTVSWKQTFDFDRYGNRTFDAANTTTLSGSVAAKVKNPQINTSDNRLKKDQDNDSVTDYDFDKNGNLTLDAENQRFVYDAENHQTAFFKPTNSSQTADATYSFDGEGKRVKKETSTEITIFVYNGGGQLVAEYSTQISQTPKLSYLTADHLGSPRIITDETGAVISRHDYTGFGVDIAEAYGSIGGRSATQGYGTDDKVRQQYTGYQHDDESGLEYAQARSYNSSHGRFTSIDPLMASANVKNPQTLNRYSYVLNSPYKFVDPLGLISSSTGACGQWCQGSGPYSDSLSGRDANLDWMREYFGDVVGYVLDQPDGSSVVNGIVIPPRPIERPATTPLPPVPPPPPLMRTKDLFLKMWSNYPVISLGYEFGHDILLDSEGKPDPSNQCAVRFSYMAMLVLANQYNGMFNGSKKNGYAIKAEEIAAWLKHVFGYSYELTGPNIADQIKDRQGIVFLKNFPGADDGVGNLRFNHIDLWNGPSYRLGSTSERKYIDGAKN